MPRVGSAAAVWTLSLLLLASAPTPARADKCGDICLFSDQCGDVCSKCREEPGHLFPVCVRPDTPPPSPPTPPPTPPTPTPPTPPPPPPPTPPPSPSASCLKECAVDSQCLGECHQCVKPANKTLGVCGDGCAMACTADAHCVNPVCSVCDRTDGVCRRAVVPTPAPTHGNRGCNATCSINLDCALGECAQCIVPAAGPPLFDAAGTPLGRCGAGCGVNCTEDAHCLAPSCPVCDKYLHSCQRAVHPPPTPGPHPAGSCGVKCVNDDQCAGECFQCILPEPMGIGACGVGCGLECANSSQCLQKGCTVCDSVSKRCVTGAAPTPAPTPGPGRCGDECVQDAYCSGECVQCVILKGAAKGKCGVACGMYCKASHECVDPTCSVCDPVSGTCEAATPPPPHATCGEPCAADSDCVGRCGQCFDSLCSAACGGECIYNSDCGLTGCTACNGTVGNKVCAANHTAGFAP